jgi:hypothetical protein
MPDSQDQSPILVAIAKLEAKMDHLSQQVAAISGIDRRVTIMETRIAESEKWLNAIKWLIGVFGLGLAGVIVQLFAKH